MKTVSLLFVLGCFFNTIYYIHEQVYEQLLGHILMVYELKPDYLPLRKW